MQYLICFIRKRRNMARKIPNRLKLIFVYLRFGFHFKWFDASTVYKTLDRLCTCTYSIILVDELLKDHFGQWFWIHGRYNDFECFSIFKTEMLTQSVAIILSFMWFLLFVFWNRFTSIIFHIWLTKSVAKYCYEKNYM